MFANNLKVNWDKRACVDHDVKLLPQMPRGSRHSFHEDY